ncbi:MAG TPA: hypothetical protein V6C81_12475 [Planktothrix sp.]
MNLEDEEEMEKSGFEREIPVVRRGITKDMLNLSKAMFSSKSWKLPLGNCKGNTKGKANRVRKRLLGKTLGNTS